MTLKLEANKFYRTRDGRKAGPLEHAGGGDFYKYLAQVDGERTAYLSDGTTYRGWDKTDLVAEWTDHTKNVDAVVGENTELSKRLANHDTETPVKRAVRLLSEARATFLRLTDAERTQLEIKTIFDYHKAEAADFPTARVRPAPTFEPFTLPDSGYEVTLQGEHVKIGCKVTDTAQGLVRILQSLNKGQLRNDGYRATRRGVTHDSKGSVTWRDADLLLERLEAYLKTQEGK